MSIYNNKLASLPSPSFDGIRDIAVSELDHLPREYRDRLYNELKHGTALIETHEQLCQYLKSFGSMHKAKLLDSLKQLPSDLFKQPFEVIDWGCGQAIGTINLFDFLNQQGLGANIKKVTLIEPSEVALERAALHISSYLNGQNNLVTISKFFESIVPAEISTKNGLPVLHLFSNIIDIEQIDLKHLSRLIDDGIVSDNYLLCVGPLNPTNRRIDAFFSYFDERFIAKLYHFESSNFGPQNKWTYKSKIYKLSVNEKGHLIPVEYYPPVQFSAAYELDAVRLSRKQLGVEFPSVYAYFEVVAPFDLGASVYDDVHPVLAVVHNLIVRGLPTKSSVFIEKVFQDTFQSSNRELRYGEVVYTSPKDIPVMELYELYDSSLDNLSVIPSELEKEIQQLLTPVAIARFQKVFLEAVITGHLDIHENKWLVLVQEEDVPFASIAIQDFEHLFEHLTALTEGYQDFTLPEIELYIIASRQFIHSPLHQKNNVYVELPVSLKDVAFDLVVTQSTFKTIDSAIDRFSNYKAKNNCYFNIRCCNVVRSERTIYTSSLIKYTNLVEKSSQGVYTEIEASIDG